MFFYYQNSLLASVVSIFGCLLVLMGLLDAVDEKYLIIVLGIALVLYYLSTGLFYDEESFIYLSFGKKSVTYHYRDIQSQQLYNAQGNLLVELYMTDGKVVQLQSTMTGAEAFMDHAFQAWLRQTGRDPRACDFHDTASYCWFPAVVTED